MGISYLLDTSILLAYVRAGNLGQHIEKTYALMNQPFKPLISVVTVGEMLKLVREFGWGQGKIDDLWNILHNCVWIDINERKVYDAYAEIADHCEHPTDATSGTSGRNKGGTMCRALYAREGWGIWDFRFLISDFRLGI